MNPSTALATVLVDELVRCGVSEVVLCPGSRSAPLAYAVHAAERTGRLRVHVRVDERSAGFLALGLGKVSRRPAVVVTTSGTAVANLHPAVLEAFHARVPLIVLSADRPAELRGAGANQATVQPGIFGGAVRWQADVPAPCGRPGEAAAWRTTVDRAWAAARGATGALGGSDCGPAHLNVGFRDPLVPDLTDMPDVAGAPDRAADRPCVEEALAGRPGGRPWTAVGERTAAAGPSAAGPLLPGTDRTVMVLGDLPEPAMAAAAHRLAARRGWPVVAEPFGAGDRAGVLPHGPLLLAATSWVDEHLPERVVVVGRVTLSRDVARLLRRPGVRVELVAATDEWADPGHVAARVHPWSALTSSELDASGLGPVDAAAAGWARRWRQAGQRLSAEADRHIRGSWPSGPALARAVLDALGPADTLVLGSSNTVRDVDLAMLPTDAAAVVAGRGLAGIDGTVSTAAGIAMGTRHTGGGRTVALMGDLTFLHDSNGLLMGAGEPVPDLTVVVANDDGGGIFATLEHGEPERGDTFARFFATPTGVDLAALCRAHGIPHRAARDPQALAGALGERAAGIRVVEVPLSLGAHRAQRAALRELAASVLGAGRDPAGR